MNPQY